MFSMLRKFKSRKGFTLVELIVVIAIIAILTAVIVPLVGRYSAQATYATLQDTAKTISNNTGYAIADATKMGIISKSDYFTGKKENGVLTVTSSEGASATSSAGVDESDTEEVICGKIADLLTPAIADNCNFRIEVDHNAVISAIYSSDNALNVMSVASDDENIAPDGDFDEAFTYNGSSVGVYGKYKRSKT